MRPLSIVAQSSTSWVASSAEIVSAMRTSGEEVHSGYVSHTRAPSLLTATSWGACGTLRLQRGGVVVIHAPAQDTVTENAISRSA
jgi:hypothetical protein